MPSQGKVRRAQGGAELVVESGGVVTVKSGGAIAVETGGAITVNGVTIDSSTTAVTGLTASAAELNETFLHLDIADGSADATYFVVAPHAGDITKIYTVTDGVVSTADITITAKIGSTGITNGVVTIATAASAAGDVDSATPTAANTVTAGQAINFVVAGGGAGGSPRIHLVAVLTR
jgi:copper homeostasis protein CutC